MRWIDKARDVAKEYKSNCKELQQIRENQELLQGANQNAPVQSSKISKPVEAAVEGLMMQERVQHLQKSIGAVEFALQRVLEKPNGDLTVKLFNMVYYNRSHTLRGSSVYLPISYETARNYNRYFLKMVSVYMGYINFIKD